MSVLQSECFEEYINKGDFHVAEAGPLHFPTYDLSVERDNKLNIVITTTANHDAISNAKEYPAGTVRINNNSVILENNFGCKVVMSGVQTFSTKTSTDKKSGTEILTETSAVDSIESIILDSTEGGYIVEWIENLDGSYFHWPDSVHRIEKNISEITISGPENEVVLKESDELNSHVRSCVSIKVDGFELYLSNSFKEIQGNHFKPGFILYKGCPSDGIREKIRNCLSFAMGRPIVYLGNSVFSHKWEIVSFKSIKPYSIGGEVFNLPTMPPAPLGKDYKGEVISEIFSRVVNSLYSKYEICNFGFVGWSYWHAICAPVHIAAIHFGASIRGITKIVYRK